MKINAKRIIVPIVILILGILIGRFSSPEGNQQGGHGHDHESSAMESAVEKQSTWTCSMHPQIKLPKQGKCPICFMDLIPQDTSGGSDEGERALKMSKAALALAEIETRVLERKEAEVKIDMVGKMAIDTTRISDIALLADAEIRRLYVNYAGIPVKKGEHLAELYSPSVYSAAQDLLVALQSQSADQELISSAKTKLKLLGVPNNYITSIEKTQNVSETYILTSPIDGYVENLVGYQGMWIKKGQMLCRVVDMGSLWAHLDAYESDLAWVRYGQSVSIRAEAMPGKKFEGTISYIPPRLDDRSRTVKVRVNVENPKGILKPGMFVSAILAARVTGSGHVTSPELRGKWISPMHPEIIKDGPGACDVCGMDLVKAEELGFSYDATAELPLLLPDSSVLITGRRAVVYIRKPGEKPVFEGREVELGPKAGDHYVVLGGLKEGERVVVKGNFKIDSALQLQAKPSMMSMEGGESLTQQLTKEKHTMIDNADLKASLEDFLGYYLSIREKLAKDDFSEITELAGDLKGELEYIDYASLKPEELKLWIRIQKLLTTSMEHLEHNKNIESFREEFKKVSTAVVMMVEKVGHPLKSLNLMFCSMANAEWLQTDDSVANPYYGASMLRCGEVKKTLSTTPEKH
ncbi:MAG: efflux RND transporter periplasmic adaptor subunit [Planctomycetes bacterium]|nr:efflux RND transporter periplasmic adaptor subunit [Planctomycetota bacterium]